jgi:7,8-dihydro-6-hydroxymethylpterin dimethyltransferase
VTVGRDVARPGEPRDYRFHAATLSLCRDCLASVPAKIVLRDGRVLLHKRCPVHGFQEELLEEDAAWYLARQEFDKPGARCLPETDARDGCPRDCGLCPDHEQHTCIGLVEITSACGLACPTCYADAGPSAARHLPVQRVASMMDAFVRAEGGSAQILQVSGGEPAEHPQILDILREARERPIGWVMLNTNGLRIASDPRFADGLAALKGRLEIYLQFDGLEAPGQRALRGRDLRAEKEAALKALADREIPVTLVMTAGQGINDHEIGAVVTHGLGVRGVRGVNIQPVAYFGRNGRRPGLDRLTMTGVLQRLESQTKGMFSRRHFVPLPCDVDRVAIGYFLRKDGAIVPASAQDKVRRHLPLIENTLMFDTGDVLRKTAEALTSGGGICNCLSFLKDFLPLAPASLLLKPQAAQAAFVTEQTFRVTVTSFLDRFNFEAHAMQKECVHVITPEGRRIPFSAYNILHRGAEART